MAEEVEVLQQLLEVASGELTGQLAEEALAEAVELLQQLRSTTGWATVQGEEFSAVALTRALGDILKLEDATLRTRGAAVYAGLLSLPDAPVGTLCEPYAFAAFVHCLKGLCLPARREAQQGGDGTQNADQAQSVSPLALLDDLGSFLRQHSMRGSPEMFGLLLDALVDLTSSALQPGGKQDKPGKRGGAAGRNQGTSVSEMAFSLLPVAMDGRHGDVAQTAALVCHRLVPTLLVPDAGKRGSHGVDRRGTALGLINDFIRAHDGARPCRLAVMRQLCLRTPDKADSRQLAVAAVQALIPDCSAEEVHSFCLFLYRLSRTHKISNRIVAVELAGALLSSLPAPFTATGAYQRLLDGSCGPGDELDAPWSALCLAIVVGRSNDKSASVRCKAMACLAECAESFAKLLMAAAEGGAGAGNAAAFVPALCASRQIRVQVVQPRGAGAAGEGGSEDGEADEPMDGQEGQARPPPEVKVSATIPGKISLDLTWMTSFCHARCRDEKAAVRKAALQLLESVLELCAAAAAQRPAAEAGRPAYEPTAQDVQVLEEATADSLVSVRKAALQVVCNLVACYPQHSGLASVWARCAMPMIRDPESAVQDAVLDRLSQLLLDPLAALGSKGGGRGRAAAAQQTAEAEVRQRLAALAQMGRAASSCIGKALSMLAAKKLLRGAHVASGLEAFLSVPQEPVATAAGAGRNGGTEAERERERRLALRDQREGAWMVLVEVAGQDPAAPSWQFLQRCWSELQTAGAGASAQEGAMLLWVISHAASRFPAADATNLAAGLLQAILGFNLPCAAVAAHLAALHKLTEAEGGREVVGAPEQWCGKVQEAAEEVLAQAMEARGNLNPGQAMRCQLALFTLGEVALLRETRVPSGAAVKVQALTNLRPGGGAATSAQANSTTTAVSAHAWTCLGKLCMVDEGLAKKCVPLLVQEMSGSPSPVVRTNLLVGLSDMVVQFTGLADAYVGRLAAMVRDPHELVRRQALALLANLLLRDFVKWRGALVHRFLLALVDESPGVRQLAQYLLSDSLATKAPMLAYNHFIESLFVLNDCSAGLHGSRAGGGSSELAAELALHSALEGSGFHLKGNTPIMRAKRDIIYTALLRRMSPEHRFAASAKLVAEILGGVVDGLLPLPQADEVLGDALRLLACKDMKVNANRFGAPAEDDGTEPLTGTQEDASKARGKLVGAMMRKHLAESVVPLMVELRYMLQAQKHPLLGSLMLTMAALLRDYKSEVEDILVADKQLAREIMHDLKHYEAMAKQQQQQQEAAMAAALGTGNRADAASGSSGDAAAGAAAPGNGQAAAPSGAAAAQRMMPPPPPPANRQRRQSAVLPGVEPSRTPVAAEVLATATKRRPAGPPQSRQQTPNGAAPAWDLEGPADAALAGAKTPAAALRGVGPAAAMRTPRTGLLGTAQRGLPGAGLPMPSPAPLSARARVQQQQQNQAGGTGALHAASPRLAAGARAGPSAAAKDTEEPLTIILPSPMPDAQNRPRPLGLHNGDAAGPSQPQDAGSKPNRTPPAALAAAVRAARQAAAEAVNGENGPQAVVGGGAAADGFKGTATGAVEGEMGNAGRGGKRGKAVNVKQEMQEEALAMGPAGVGIKAEAVEEHGGRVRVSKRRHGGA